MFMSEEAEQAQSILSVRAELVRYWQVCKEGVAGGQRSGRHAGASVCSEAGMDQGDSTQLAPPRLP